MKKRGTSYMGRTPLTNRLIDWPFTIDNIVDMNHGHRGGNSAAVFSLPMQIMFRCFFLPGVVGILMWNRLSGRSNDLHSIDSNIPPNSPTLLSPSPPTVRICWLLCCTVGPARSGALLVPGRSSSAHRRHPIVVPDRVVTIVIVISANPSCCRPNDRHSHRRQCFLSSLSSPPLSLSSNAAEIYALIRCAIVYFFLLSDLARDEFCPFSTTLTYSYRRMKI
jgi:hypothetical protein